MTWVSSCSKMRIVLALALLSGVAAFAPLSARRPSAAAALRPRPDRTARPSTTVAMATLPDDPFPGVAECPLTAWGPRDVRVREERIQPR